MIGMIEENCVSKQDYLGGLSSADYNGLKREN
jgi:hypothetical protein